MALRMTVKALAAFNNLKFSSSEKTIKRTQIEAGQATETIVSLDF